jgi:hypothetical protein
VFFRGFRGHHDFSFHFSLFTSSLLTLVIALPATGGSCRTMTEIQACPGADRPAHDHRLTGTIGRQKNLSEALGY